IVGDLLTHDEDADDIHLPLLLWWAIESRCENDRDAVLALFSDVSLWTRPVVARHILPRLMQRFAATWHRKDLLLCAQLLKLSPGKESTARLMQGFEEAFKGRSLGGIPEELARALEEAGGGSELLALRRKQPEAIEKGLKLIADGKADVRHRVQ